MTKAKAHSYGEWKKRWMTARQCKNRGFTPVNYLTDRGEYYGWIEKESTRWLHLYVPAFGRMRVAKSEREHMREVA